MADIKIIAENRKARFDYFIEDTYECGIELQGTEVKSVKNGNISFPDAFADQFNRIHRKLRATVPGICKSTVRNPTVLRKLKDICVSGSQKLVQSCIRIQNHTHSYHKSKPLFTSMIALYQKQCTIIRTYRTRPTIRNSSSGEAGFGAYALL